MGLPRKLAKRIAAAHVAHHNEGSKKYKAAFAKYGTRMWRDDDNHPLKPEHEEYIADYLHKSNLKPTFGSVHSVHPATRRPLTVHHGFIHKDTKQLIPKHQQEALSKDVDTIHAQHSEEWKTKLKGIINEHNSSQHSETKETYTEHLKAGGLPHEYK